MPQVTALASPASRWRRRARLGRTVRLPADMLTLNGIVIIVIVRA